MNKKRICIIIALIFCWMLCYASDNRQHVKLPKSLQRNQNINNLQRSNKNHKRQQLKKIEETSLIEIIDQNWENGGWINEYRTLVRVGIDLTSLYSFLDDFESGIEALSQDPSIVLYNFFNLDLIPDFYYLEQIWQNNTWQDEMQIISENDYRDVLSKLIIQFPMDGLVKYSDAQTSWQTMAEVYLTSDENFYLTELLFKADLEETGSVEDVVKFFLYYDDNYNPTKYSASLYTQSQWIEAYQILLQNDENGWPLTETAQVKYPVVGWTDLNRIVRTFNDQGYILTYTYQKNSEFLSKASINQEVTTDWGNVDMDEYKWDTNFNLIEYVYSIWENHLWKFSEKESFEYNANGNLTVWLLQLWDNIWNNAEQELTAYDANDDPVTVRYQSWDGMWQDDEKDENTFQDHKIVESIYYKKVDNAWQQYYRAMWNYEGAVKVDDHLPSPAEYSLRNLSNPFNPCTEIQYTITRVADVKLAVYDVLGCFKGVLFQGKQQAGKHHFTFDAGHLSSGVYFTALNVDGKIDRTRMILIK